MNRSNCNDNVVTHTWILTLRGVIWYLDSNLPWSCLSGHYYSLNRSLLANLNLLWGLGLNGKITLLFLLSQFPNCWSSKIIDLLQGFMANRAIWSIESIINGKIKVYITCSVKLCLSGSLLSNEQSLCSLSIKEGFFSIGKRNFISSIPFGSLV